MEVAAELYIIVIGLLGLIILFTIVNNYYPLFESSGTIVGSNAVASELAREAMSCWEEHRLGIDSVSELCKSMDVQSEILVTEEMFTNNLNCERLPNSVCDGNPCACTSTLFTDQERVRWLVENENTTIKVSYDAETRQISVLDIRAKAACFNGVQDPNEDGTDCGGECVACTSDTVTCQAEEAADACTSVSIDYATACCKEYGLCCSVTTTTATIPATTTTTMPTSLCSPEGIASRLSGGSMISNLQFLTAENRPYGSPRGVEVGNFIRDELEAYGLNNVHFEDFAPFPVNSCNQNGRNVIGELGPDGAPIVVIGGHRDSIVGVGAVDNGGGAVTVMDVAKALAPCDAELNNKIVFVLFDGEERGLCGSIEYVSRHSSDNIIRMINHDCGGFEQSSEIGIFRTATDVATAANECCIEHGITCNDEGAFNIPGASSDHAPFQAAGIQYGFFGTWDNGCGFLHTTQDTMNTIDSQNLVWTAELTSCVISKLYIG